MTIPVGDLDHRGSAWYADKIVAGLVFVGGISAIVFIIGIFAFITKEGAGFVFVERLERLGGINEIVPRRVPLP